MSTTEIPGLKEAKEWAEEHYNDAISVYEFSNYIRITNGSGGHYIDIYLADDGDNFLLKGEKYGETINKTCKRGLDTLEDVMAQTI